MIFGVNDSPNFLQDSENRFMDFLTVPPQFVQLYTVHGLSQGRHIVGACGLPPNKRSTTYIEFLTQIHNLVNPRVC